VVFPDGWWNRPVFACNRPTGTSPPGLPNLTGPSSRVALFRWAGVGRLSDTWPEAEHPQGSRVKWRGMESHIDCPLRGMPALCLSFLKTKDNTKNESKTRVKLGRPQTWTANTKNVTPKCWKLTSTTHPKPTSTSGVTSCRSVGVKQPGALVKPVANEVETKNYVSICIYVYR